MAIVTKTLEEIKKIPPMTEEEIDSLNNFEENFDDSDCPPMTKSQMKEFKPAYETHPEWYKVKKTSIQVRIDNDVLAALKAMGKGYQTRINSILRQAVFG